MDHHILSYIVPLLEEVELIKLSMVCRDAQRYKHYKPSMFEVNKYNYSHSDYNTMYYYISQGYPNSMLHYINNSMSLNPIQDFLYLAFIHGNTYIPQIITITYIKVLIRAITLCFTNPIKVFQYYSNRINISISAEVYIASIEVGNDVLIQYLANNYHHPLKKLAGSLLAIKEYRKITGDNDTTNKELLINSLKIYKNEYLPNTIQALSLCMLDEYDVITMLTSCRNLVEITSIKHNKYTHDVIHATLKAMIKCNDTPKSVLAIRNNPYYFPNKRYINIDVYTMCIKYNRLDIIKYDIKHIKYRNEPHGDNSYNQYNVLPEEIYIPCKEVLDYLLQLFSITDVIPRVKSISSIEVYTYLMNISSSIIGKYTIHFK